MGLLIVYAVLSWVQARSPISDVITRLCEPLLRPVRRVLPLLGGVDLSPLVVLVLTVLQLSLSTMHGRAAGSGSEAWLHFASGLFVLWSFLMLPLFVTLQAALLGNMEHANYTWKHLLTLPLPLW